MVWSAAGAELDFYVDGSGKGDDVGFSIY